MILGDLSSFCLYAVFCATSLNHISSFYTELMKGLGASARLFELRNRIPAIPITGLHSLCYRINNLLFRRIETRKSCMRHSFRINHICLSVASRYTDTQRNKLSNSGWKNNCSCWIVGQWQINNCQLAITVNMPDDTYLS